MGADLDGVHPKLGSKGSGIVIQKSDLAVRLDFGSLYIKIYLLNNGKRAHSYTVKGQGCGWDLTNNLCINTDSKGKSPQSNLEPSCHDVTIRICPPTRLPGTLKSEFKSSLGGIIIAGFKGREWRQQRLFSTVQCFQREL